ncbi:hypothetical protein DDB_G0270662 [Dictyostelium discoideum AX4]|uniref:Uncharacterized protein n=1 Tax=Dictyostelium discoideum TaxID=44689 RepID=Q55CZ8_DICDI|nr:hypothetical protein DDB_G0270662 [Dictyostelium discoideum AX4]EAL72681.1 hypothetical protein DDB_G0270662 [Dictyostelium discoideum AX4]|eukprot:XP_646333.1 hypothetical protein DDB_G0270662 [Dictyostelium discoideum AX4]
MGHALGTILLLILAFIFSPLSVFFVRGCGKSLVINCLLFIIGVIPGIIHAIWFVSFLFPTLITLSFLFFSFLFFSFLFFSFSFIENGQQPIIFNFFF